MVLCFASFVLFCLRVAAESDDGFEQQNGFAPLVESTERAVAIMLLGSISFKMTLFYLVNHSDDDIKRYSWQVIGSTISIFSAVLLFQGWNGVIDTYIVPIFGLTSKIGIRFLALGLWFSVMQLSLAICSGAVTVFGIGAEEGDTGEEAAEQRELAVKCWSVLFAHMTAFAAMDAWCSIQQVPPFNKTPLSAFMVVPLAGFAIATLFRVVGHLRKVIARSDDGEFDACEVMWEKETEESENDVFGLVLAFTTTQAFRFAIGGELPNAEGLEKDRGISHTGMEVLYLWACGLCCLVALFVLTEWRGRLKRAGFHRHKFMFRGVVVLQNYSSMTFAFCVMFSMKWLLAISGYVDPESNMAHVTLALLVSCLAFTMIFFLDMLSDSDATGKDADKALRMVILAIGVLIGFTWEQSFDQAVDTISEMSSMPHITKLCLAALLSSIVLPAYRHFILGHIMTLHQEEKAKKQKEEEGEGKRGESTEALATPLRGSKNVYEDVLDSAERGMTLKYSVQGTVTGNLPVNTLQCNGCVMRNEALLALAQHFDKGSEFGRCAAELVEAIKNAQSSTLTNRRSSPGNDLRAPLLGSDENH